MSPEPFFVPPNIPSSRRGSAATLGRSSRRRSSGAISTHSQKSRKCIGDYIVGKTLGKGASGRVKLGVHRYTGEQVAIKIISKTYLAANPAIEKAVRREIAIMKLIHHPNVMSLIDVIDDPASSDLYLILEYVEGGELFEYLVGKGCLNEAEARHHFQQIILGLDYCHHYLICHRDLKPENLLLDSRNNIKIADFGMASLQPLGSMLETSCGSPHYASPEIVTGVPYHGSSCDIWSCGVILYALLTGHLPFDDENIRLLLKKVKIGRYAMPDNISASAQDLIRRILVVDPTKRLTMRQIMHHPWFRESEPMHLSILPVPPTAKEIGQPVADAAEIDDRILETIKFLWGESENETVIEALIQKEHNMQKVVYVLLQQHAERYWQTNHGGESDEEEIIDCQRYKTVRSRKSNRLTSPWSPTTDQSENLHLHYSGITLHSVDSEKSPSIMKKNEHFYAKLVKRVLPKKQIRNTVEEEQPKSNEAADAASNVTTSVPSTTGTIRAAIVGTLRRKNPFQRAAIKDNFESTEGKTAVDDNDIPLPYKHQSPSLTVKANKGLSLRIPNALNTINSKKFGFTLGAKKQPSKQQPLDLATLFQQPSPDAAARSSQVTFQSMDHHPRRSSFSSTSRRTATPSLLSATSSTLPPSPTTPTTTQYKTSWLDQLFFFKQPKVCSLVVYSTHKESILRTLHRNLNKNAEARFYEKPDGITGVPRYKAEIKTKPEIGVKGRQVKCRIDLIIMPDAQKSCVVQFTQQQGDGVLLQMLIQELQEAMLTEYPCP